MFHQSKCIMNTDYSTRGISPLKLIRSSKKSKNFLGITGYQRMSNNKFVEMCDQAYLFKTVPLTHIHTSCQTPHQFCKQNSSVTKTRYSNNTTHVLDESAKKGTHGLGTNNILGNYACWERIILKWILTTRTCDD